MKKLKIYVASSWRNNYQQAIVKELRVTGYFDVYDFKNPEIGNKGFSWSEIDTDWKNWEPKTFSKKLSHPLAVKHFNLDMCALRDCDICICVLPCGRSAHLELGFAVGAKKQTYVLFPNNNSGIEPELMYKMCDQIHCNLDDIIEHILWVNFGISRG